MANVVLPRYSSLVQEGDTSAAAEKESEEAEGYVILTNLLKTVAENPEEIIIKLTLSHFQYLFSSSSSLPIVLTGT